MSDSTPTKAGKTATRRSAALNPATVAAIVCGEATDPFAVLGLHERLGQLWVTAFLPRAHHVRVIDGAGLIVTELPCVHVDGLFDGPLPAGRERAAYRLRVDWDGVEYDVEDPYRFPPLLGATDVWLIAEGRHRRLHEVMGAHRRCVDGVDGTSFAVWAPGARRVAVIGDFNDWDRRRHPMRLRRECGVWELFLPGVVAGARYKYDLIAATGEHLPHKADPFAFASELRPHSASVVTDLPPPRQAAGPAAGYDRPIAIYEVHAASWRRAPDGRIRHWSELAAELIPYVSELGFTHIELLPVTEHPFDGSWGYQPTGLYAPTARHGDAQAFADFVSACQAAGLGILLDWVPGHFPSDAHALARFDGTHLYEHADPRQGVHRDWDTLIYNYGRHEVRNFLSANALFWLERYGLDGLRVDAVASMLYLDYSREPGDWIPNADGGRENLDAVRFITETNALIHEAHPQAVTIAEESTAWPRVSHPTNEGGLGFAYKWNMGWMHDTLSYMRREPVHRRFHHDELTFGLLYAFHEHFVLPLSHDEVVHGKGSLLSKMPGDDWQRFANLRLYYGFMWAHPGKKLLFMGGEFGQWAEWDHDGELDWAAAATPPHRGVSHLVADLNRLYRTLPALHQCDCEPRGFEWIDCEDREQSVLAFLRRGRTAEQIVIAVCNFTPVPRHGYRVGVPGPGHYRELLNTDSAWYGGSDLGNAGGVDAVATPCHGRSWSLSITLPPLACVLLGVDC